MRKYYSELSDSRKLKAMVGEQLKKEPKNDILLKLAELSSALEKQRFDTWAKQMNKWKNKDGRNTTATTE